MKKQELIEKLKATGTLSSSAFIPVSEVLIMIEDLEDENSGLDPNVIDDIAEEIVSQLDTMGRDVLSDYEIDTDVSGNTIEVTVSSLSFDIYQLESIVEEAIEKFVPNKKENNQ
jgi:hypothetical protein